MNFFAIKSRGCIIGLLGLVFLYLFISVGVISFSFSLSLSPFFFPSFLLSLFPSFLLSFFISFSFLVHPSVGLCETFIMKLNNFKRKSMKININQLKRLHRRLTMPDLVDFSTSYFSSNLDTLFYFSHGRAHYILSIFF